MTESTDWVSAIAILASGLILGLMFIYFVGRRRAAAAAATTGDVDLELRDLEAKRDALIEQIRELDDMGSKLGAAEAAEERTRLELATAGVLREIDSHKRVAVKTRKGAPVSASAATAAAAVPETPGVTSRNPATIGFLWGAGSVAALALMGYLVVRYATPRQEGGSMTGNTPGEQAPMQQPQAADAETKSLEAAVAQQPDNLGLRVELARVYLERENMMGVFDQTQYVLSKSPNEPRALTYQALVRLAMGQSKEAGEMLEQATKIAPNLLDSWVALAWVRTQEGNAKAADAAIAAAIKQHPEEKARLEEVLTQMRTRPSEPAQMAGGGGGGGELPPGHPPITPDSPRVGPVTATAPVAAPPPAAAAAASGQGVRITVSAGPGAAGKKGTLFILARAAGVMAGPPVAVRRMPVTTLPVTIDLSAADSMMGQPLPPKMRLEARLDSDGDAFTKDPKDPQAVQDGVSPGTTVSMSLQ